MSYTNLQGMKSYDISSDISKHGLKSKVNIISVKILRIWPFPITQVSVLLVTRWLSCCGFMLWEAMPERRLVYEK